MENINVHNSLTLSSNSNISAMNESRPSLSPSSPNTLPVATFAPLRRSHRRAFSLPTISVSTLDLASPSSLDTNSILPVEYIEESAFYQVIDASFANHQPIGPPPASEKAIKKLPEIKIDESNVDSHKCCSICFDNFQVGANNVVSLPCSHAFDRGCVVQWLAQHNTCPICRYELPTLDSEVEDSMEEYPSVSASNTADGNVLVSISSRSLSFSGPEDLSFGQERKSLKSIKSSRSSVGSKSASQSPSNRYSLMRMSRGTSTSS